MSRLYPTLVVMCLVVLTETASANQPPARVEEQTAGPYRLEITFFEALPTVSQPVHFAVRAVPGSPALDGAVITALGVPGPETLALSTRPVALQPEPEFAGSYVAGLLLSVRGAWDLEVHIAGPAGKAIARIPVAVAVPYAMPVWLGWVIGMSPLLVLGWFAWWQRGYLRLLMAEDEPVTSSVT